MAASGVFTNAYRAKLAQVASNFIPDGNPGKDQLELVNFKVGEGGSTVPPAPDAPDPARTDIEAATTMGYLSFTKAIGAANISDDGAGTLTINCILSATEPGLDGNGQRSGTDPHLYEVGVFDDAGTMMVYATYDEQVKTAGNQITISVVVTY